MLWPTAQGNVRKNSDTFTGSTFCCVISFKRGIDLETRAKGVISYESGNILPTAGHPAKTKKPGLGEECELGEVLWPLRQSIRVPLQRWKNLPEWQLCLQDTINQAFMLKWLDMRRFWVKGMWHLALTEYRKGFSDLMRQKLNTTAWMPSVTVIVATWSFGVSQQQGGQDGSGLRKWWREGSIERCLEKAHFRAHISSCWGKCLHFCKSTTTST